MGTIYADLEAKNLTPWVLGTTEWLRLGIRFMHCDLGYIDLEEKTLQPSPTLFAQTRGRQLPLSV
jgi:hypothetical protein